MNINSHEHWMHIAIELAKQAEEAGEVPVGAIVVKDKQIIGRGANAPIRLHDPSAHAEMLAIRQAAQTLGNYRLVDCTLYVTLEPCLMCTGVIQHSRIASVVFGAHDAKTGACGSVVDMMAEARLNHHASVISGILADNCGELLTRFFRERRAKQKNIS